MDPLTGRDPLASSGDEMDSSTPAANSKAATSGPSAPQGGDRPRLNSSVASSCSDTRSLPSSSATPTANSISNLSQQIRKLKNAAAAPRVLGGQDTIRTKNYGSLHGDPATDQRHQLAHLRELYDKKLNVSTSFDPASLTCTNCLIGPHHILHPSARNEPCCFILSNQCFPAALPSVTSSNCLAIVRVEDATLVDLVSTVPS